MILIGFCLGWAFAASAITPGIVLTKCSLIDGKGNEPVKNAVILVKDGIIEYAGPVEESKIPARHAGSAFTGKKMNGSRLEGDGY